MRYNNKIFICFNANSFWSSETNKIPSDHRNQMSYIYHYFSFGINNHNTEPYTSTGITYIDTIYCMWTQVESCGLI